MKKIGNLKTYTSKEITDSYVSIGFECIDRELINPDKCYDLLEKSGVKYARCQTGWARCEKEKGVYDFEWLDSIVDNLVDRGIIPWFNVGYGNPVYMNDLPNPTGVGCVPVFYGKEAIDAWNKFVAAITERYKGKVKHYEIWNEPDLGHFWYPENPDAKEYADFVKSTASVIKSVNKNAKTGADVSSPYNIEYIKAFIDNLNVGDIDFFSIHAYTTIPEYRYANIISFIRRKLDSKGLNDVELWQGEAGYPSWAYKNHWLVKEGCDSEKAQAIWQLRRYFLDVFNGIKLSSFFQIADMWERPYEKAVEAINKPAAHGILNGITYTPKESYKTITNLSAVLCKDLNPTRSYIDIALNDAPYFEFISAFGMSFEKNSFPLYAYYLPGDVSKNESFDYKATVRTEERIIEPVLVDLYSGEVYAIDDVSTFRGMACYNDMPVKNYPLIITDKRAIETE